MEVNAPKSDTAAGALAGRRLRQAAPSELFATGCAEIDSILRDKVVPEGQDTKHYLGPFSQYPPQEPPNGTNCAWQIVTSGEEAYALFRAPTPRVKFIEATTVGGNFPDRDTPPIRAPPEGLTPAAGTIVFFKGNGLTLDMTQLDAAKQPYPPPFNDTAERTVRVMWDWHIVVGASAPLRPASLAFTYTTNLTQTSCKVRPILDNANADNTVVQAILCLCHAVCRIQTVVHTV